MPFIYRWRFLRAWSFWSDPGGVGGGVRPGGTRINHFTSELVQIHKPLLNTVIVYMSTDTGNQSFIWVDLSKIFKDQFL